MNKSILTLLLLSITTIVQASSEFPVCEFTQKYLSKDLKLKIECQDKYLLYCQDSELNRKNGCAENTRSSSTKSPSDLKIAGFNLYNLGMEQDMKGNKLTALKNFQILAQVISQFDLVAAIELKHQAKEDFVFNQALQNNPKADLHYRVPAYLQVLKYLQKIDSSWTLILSSDLFSTNADDTLNNELSGYFFRKDKVNLAQTEYCKTWACAVASDEFQAEVARKPFLASFKSGKLDFTMAAVHFRFRFPYIRNGKEEQINEELYLPMNDVYDFSKHTGYRFNTKVKSQREQQYETHSRFSEVKSVVNFLGKMIAKSKRKDVLLYGDFNLMAPAIDEPLPKKKKDADLAQAFKKAWFDSNGVLQNFKNATPYINAPSTLGKNELNNPFDHFVFSKQGSLKKCDTENANVYNFTNRDIFLQGDEMIRDIDVESFKQELMQEMKFEKGKYVPRYSKGKIGFLVQGLKTKVLESYQQGTLTVYQELISDHLPVFMDCKTK